MSKGGRYARHDDHNAPKKGKSKIVTVLTILVVVLVLVVAAMLGVIVYRGTMDRLADQVPTIPVITEEPEETQLVESVVETEAAETTAPIETTEDTTIKGTVNFLLVGQSYREGEESRLADTLILATVNKDTKTLTLTSFLRDTYVDLPDYGKLKCGWNKINTAYALGYTQKGTGGAMEMTSMTIKDNFGVEVDHAVEVNFDGFMDMINILGGVDIYLNKAEADYLNNDDVWVRYDMVPDQVNTLDGMAALCYARMRKAAGDGGSDIKRSARQRALITAVIEKLKTCSLNRMRYLAEEALKLVVTDMTNEEIDTCIWELIPILPELTVETNVMPAEGTYWDKELQVGEYTTWALQFDAKKNREIMMNIAESDVMNAPAPTQD